MQNTVANAHQQQPRSPWHVQNGFWGFEYQFVDGSRGSANHKQETPKFAPGTVVSYDIVGEFQGLNKIKFHQQQPTQGGAAPQQSYQAPAQAASDPRQAASGPIHGATVDKNEGQRNGMCYKLAGDYVLKIMDTSSTIMSEDEFVSQVATLAVKLVHASKQIEH